MPLHAITYRHIPSHTVTYRHIPSHTVTYDHVPLHVVTYRYIHAARCGSMRLLQRLGSGSTSSWPREVCEPAEASVAASCHERTTFWRWAGECVSRLLYVAMRVRALNEGGPPWRSLLAPCVAVACGHRSLSDAHTLPSLLARVSTTLARQFLPPSLLGCPTPVPLAVTCRCMPLHAAPLQFAERIFGLILSLTMLTAPAPTCYGRRLRR